MGLLDWVKETFGGGEPKPAPSSTSAYRQQVPKQAQTDTPAPSSRGLQKRPLTEAEKQHEKDMMLSGRFTTPAQRASVSPTKEQERAAVLSGSFKPEVTGITDYRTVQPGGFTRLNSIVDVTNKTNAEVRDKIKTPTELLDLTQERQLEGYMYDMRPDDWKMLQDNFGTKDAPVTEGTLLRVQGPGLEYQPPKVQADEYSAAPLTWDAYNALSSDQKAAVDLNTLMVEAREKDLSKEWKLDEAEQKEYDAKVERIFGATGGSEKVAPNMVRLLDEIDVKALGQDLDEYLSLERGFTMDEIENFEIDKDAIGGLVQLGDAEQPGVTVADVRNPENKSVLDQAVTAKASDLIAEKMREANYAISNFQGAVIDPLLTPGGPTATPGLGYGDPGARPSEYEARMEEWLQKAYATLQSPTGNVDDVIGEMDYFEFTPEERQYFLEYVNERSLGEDQYGLPPEVAATLRSGDEIRTILGIGG